MIEGTSLGGGDYSSDLKLRGPPKLIIVRVDAIRGIVTGFLASLQMDEGT